MINANVGNESTLDFDFATKDTYKDENPFGKALLEFEQRTGVTTDIKVGNKVTGKLVSKSDKYAFIDFRGKTSACIDVTAQESMLLANIEVGAEVTVLITSVDDKDTFEIGGSLYQLKLIEMTDFLNNVYNKRIALTGVPTDHNHAGYNITVNVDGQDMCLFMPHLLTDVNKLPNPESILNTEIEFYLEQVRKDGQVSYIASRKAYLLNMAIKEKRNLKKGGQYDGFVTGCTDFAVFVQFNQCLTGMIHKSNLTEQAVAMLPNIPAGTTIEFYVKDIMKDKLFLTQVLRDSLWDTIATNDELTGTISSIKDFGVMVDLDYETKGLLHKSVLHNPVDTYKKGDSVRVVVTNVNKSNRQITLALK
jgi:ribosomal protein S1